MEDQEKKNCWTCGYVGSVPGSAHARCKFDWEKAKKRMPEGSVHGIRNGWWAFPLNYDPVWMVGECQEWAKEINPELVREKYPPLMELFALLTR